MPLWAIHLLPRLSIACSKSLSRALLSRSLCVYSDCKKIVAVRSRERLLGLCLRRANQSFKLCNQPKRASVRFSSLNRELTLEFFSGLTSQIQILISPILPRLCLHSRNQYGTMHNRLCMNSGAQAFRASGLCDARFLLLTAGREWEA